MPSILRGRGRPRHTFLRVLLCLSSPVDVGDKGTNSQVEARSYAPLWVVFLRDFPASFSSPEIQVIRVIIRAEMPLGRRKARCAALVSQAQRSCMGDESGVGVESVEIYACAW